MEVPNRGPTIIRKPVQLGNDTGIEFESFTEDNGWNVLDTALLRQLPIVEQHESRIVPEFQQPATQADDVTLHPAEKLTRGHDHHSLGKRTGRVHGPMRSG